MWKPPDDEGKVPAGRQQRCVTGSRLLLLERMRSKVSSPLVELPSLLSHPFQLPRVIMYESVQLVLFVIADTRRSGS